MSTFPKGPYTTEVFQDVSVPLNPILPGEVRPSSSNKVVDIYSVKPYEWDGRSRPNVDDYTSPWIEKASQTMYKSTGTKKKKATNAEITYAKNQLEAALAKYKSDFDFWAEMDERSYTSQSAQAQRYEEAGFNLGYMYGNIDSGNSSVGYSNPDVSFSPNENVGDNLGEAKLVTDVVSSIVSVASSLISAGVSVAQLPSKIASMKANTAVAEASVEWQKVLRSINKDGVKVNDVTKSLAFELQSIGVKSAATSLSASQEQLKQLTEFTNHCANIYSLQGTDQRKEMWNSTKEVLNSLDLSWLGENEGFGRFILQTLSFFALNKLN